MYFWKKVKVLLSALLMMSLTMNLAGCEGSGREVSVRTGRASGEELALAVPTVWKSTLSHGRAERVRIQQYREIWEVRLSKAKPYMEGEARSSAILEDRDFVYFYDGCEIRKISKESKETAIIWKSGFTEDISLDGQAILAGDKIFFIEHWWSMGFITETLSVINTDGTGYECIERRNRNGGYLYFVDGILYVEDGKSVWEYVLYADGTWKKIKTLTGNVSRALPEALKTGSVAFANQEYLLDVREEDLYLTDNKTPESRYLAERSGWVIGMDEEYVYLERYVSDSNVGNSIAYEKIAIRDGEKSTIFLQDDFSDIYAIHHITESYKMSQIVNNYVYYVEEMDYNLYLMRRSLDNPPESEILGEAFYDIGISRVGRVEKYWERTDSEVKPGCGAVTVDIERLVVDEKFPGAAEINRLFRENQEAILSDVAESVAYMEKVLGGIADPDFKMHTSYTSVISPVFYYDGRYFSFYQEDDENLDGGIHGRLYREGYTFDLQTGKRLTLRDVIGNSEEELNDIVTGYFAAYMDGYSETDPFWEDAMDTVRERISMESDFYLTEEGICFYLPPYAITYFAAGFQEVTVPYDEFEVKIVLE